MNRVLKKYHKGFICFRRHLSKK